MSEFGASFCVCGPCLFCFKAKRDARQQESRPLGFVFCLPNVFIFLFFAIGLSDLEKRMAAVVYSPGLFLFGIFALIPPVFYIVALNSDQWSLMSTPLADFAIGPFKSTIDPPLIPAQHYHGCELPHLSDAQCDRLRVTQAFVIAATILTGLAILFGIVGRFSASGFTFFISGLTGLTGWLVWWFNLRDHADTLVGDHDAFDVGYAQALVIAAWAGSIVLGVYSRAHLVVVDYVPI
eukprot:m.56623 g.56623  ORF g.56623 m.56623 type:complete len:236 (-) comp12046_c0_seq1:33-740(-)